MTDNIFSLENKKIWVAGHRGLVGSALCRRLADEKCSFVLASRNELDLRRQDSVDSFMRVKKPDVVILAAARVGGVHANNTYPADFLYDNLAIETNVIQAAWRHGVDKFLFLGSSCIYPREAPQPIREEDLLSGHLEPTNEWYAIAKIAGIKLSQAYRRQYGCDFITAMPCNLYGPRDNFDLERSHIVPALMRKAHEARAAGTDLEIWGTGTPRRELMYVDDLADAAIFLLKNYSGEMPINVGTGYDMTVREIAEHVCRTVGFDGLVRYNASRPDGVARKLMDSGRLQAMGWRPSTSLKDGLAMTYDWYQTFSETRMAA
jgi:GDP-L-fucose synthase